MSPRPLALLALVAWPLGCDRKPEPPPEPSRAATAAATSAPAPTAPAASSPASAPAASAPAPAASGPAGKNKLCERLLTAADIKAACGLDVTAAPPPGADEPETQPTFTCTRRFTAGGRWLSVLLTRLADPKQAKQAFDDQGKSRKEEPEFKALAGLGDGARRYVTITMTGDLNHTVELLKGPHTLKVFTPKVTSNNNDFAPVCTLDQLEALAKTAVSRL